MALLKLAAGPAIAALVAFGASGNAAANTVTFNGIADYDTVMISGGTGSPYQENGVTVTSIQPLGLLASDTRPGMVHLDDSGTDFTAGVAFTTGGIFDVLGFSFESLGFDFLGAAPVVMGNILLTGFVNGNEVVRDRVTASPLAGTFQTVTLGAGFMGLDRFVIEILYPTTGSGCGAPCGHINLDEVVLSDTPVSAVPLPASGLLLGLAAFGLWAFARRRT